MPAPTDIDWRRALERFPIATPGMLATRELQRRTDTKFVLPCEAALDRLAGLASNYAVLLAGGQSIASYRTLYFDTPELELFHAHRCGRRIRHKVRIRHYLERAVSTLEIKSRRNERETRKTSLPHCFGSSELSAGDRQFLAGALAHAEALSPQVWTNFRRITLLGLQACERVTIDLDLEFVGSAGRVAFAECAVVEVKQWPSDRGTPVMAALRAGGHRPASLSKYCAAISASHDVARRSGSQPRFPLQARSLSA